MGVIGTGALGSQHVRLYSEIAREGGIIFSGIYDCKKTLAKTLGEKYQVPVANSIDALAESADALSIVTPTNTHFELSKSLLKKGKHLLIEKPITQTQSQASELLSLAHRHRCLLQVGHVERFNPVFKSLREVAKQPRFIEAHRLSPFPFRSTDIGVVLDLMIHDLDIVLAFVRSRIVSVEGVGISVLSRSEDIANARLHFENGCVANLTASRISPEKMRKIRVFNAGTAASYVSLDYDRQEGFIYHLDDAKSRSENFEKDVSKQFSNDAKPFGVISEFAGRRIVRKPVPIKKKQPLKLQLESFVQCIQSHKMPVVSGESAKQALDLAIEITEQIHSKK